jgi:Family of unknown function (DUF6152)
MRNKLIRVIAGVGILLASTLPLIAHHSFAAEFDAQKKVTLEGKVVKLEMVNPHSWIYFDVTAPDGKVEHWKAEGGSPSVLLRLGWNRDTLPVGTKIKISGNASKDGSTRMNTSSIEFADGKKLSMGGSNPDAEQPK